MDTLSPAAIQELKSLYPTPTESLRLHPVLGNPWYLVAAVAFNAARKPEAVISVYKAVLEDLEKHSDKDVNIDDHVTLVKRIHEALLKASLINGIPRVSIDILLVLIVFDLSRISKTVTTASLLNTVVPKSILEKLSSPLRDFDRPFSDIALHGRQFFSELFGDDVGEGQSQYLLNTSSPDIGIFTAASYGLILGYSSVLSLLETSYIHLAANILDDSPRVVYWFYLAAQQHGATIEETKAIRDMALKVASLSNITLQEKVPEVVAKELLQIY
ncbi:hypothetical protein ONZ45_g6311 [Pleurotus djamor]|nr:hypothetical protein ONZ45_g6311 [Pleurotus djamor]